MFKKLRDILKPKSGYDKYKEFITAHDKLVDNGSIKSAYTEAQHINKSQNLSLSDSIKSTVGIYKKHTGLNAKQLNGGYCEYIATDSSNHIPDAKVRHSWDYAEQSLNSTNKRHIAIHNKLQDGNFHDDNGHTWIEHNGKHYDSEAPNGVNHPYDLPHFKRL